MPSQRVKLEIGGATYVLSTNDPEEYILALAERLDEDLNRLMIETPNASVTAAAVITALGYLDDIEKTSRGADNMRAQIQDYLEDAAKAKIAAEEARREADRLRRELAALRGGKPPARQHNAPQASARQSREATPPAADSAQERIAGQLEIDEL